MPPYLAQRRPQPPRIGFFTAFFAAAFVVVLAAVFLAGMVALLLWFVASCNRLTR